MITGKTLIDWGFDPKDKGKWFGEAIDLANSLRKIGMGDHYIIRELKDHVPQLPPEIPYRTNPISVRGLSRARNR